MTRHHESWDTIRVTRFDGLQALERISAPGAVVVDPNRAVYFFITRGGADLWPPELLNAVSVIRTGLALPPRTRRRPPGMYWLLAPRTRRLTPADQLGNALAKAVVPGHARAA